MNRPYRLPNASPERILDQRVSQGWLPRGWIDGLVLSNNASDATNDIDIAAGVTRSTSNRVNGVISTLAKDQRDIEIDTARIKQLDVVWAPGNGGGKSAEAIANATWHWLAIGGKGVKDDLIALSALTSATVIHNALPGGYTAYRMIMSTVRASAAILPFRQVNERVNWVTPLLDYSQATPGGSLVTVTATVPVGIVTRAIVQPLSSGVWGYVHPLFAADGVPSNTNGLANFGGNGGIAVGTEIEVICDTSAQYGFRLSSTAATYIATIGFIHPRGRDA